ncbi:MAG: hypothetical protein WCF65_07430 [Parachlamydiaceae bacterium]
MVQNRTKAIGTLAEDRLARLRATDLTRLSQEEVVSPLAAAVAAAIVGAAAVILGAVLAEELHI